MNSKKHKLPRRILAMLLAICMFVTMFPSAMFAVGGSDAGATPATASAAAQSTVTASSEDGLNIVKSITGSETSGYNLKLEAYASEEVITTTTTSPLDIVLVLDRSGSMNDDGKLNSMKNAVNSFIDSVANSANAEKHRIGIVTFASEASSYAGLTYMNQQDAADLEDKVDDIWARGATRVDYGLSEAKDMLDQVPADRNSEKVVIVFTDGEPTSGSSFENKVAAAAINNAHDLKADSTTVYTIGMFSEANPSDINGQFNKYMNAMSSNYPDAQAEYEEGHWSWNGWVPEKYNVNLGTRAEKDYYFSAQDANELEAVFDGISETLTQGKLEAHPGTESILSDTLSKYFALPEGTDPKGITVEKVKATGYIEGQGFQFAETGTPATEAQVEIINDKTINVKGFDYETNVVSRDKKTGAVKGYKLVVTIPIIPDTGYEGWDEGTNPYATNSAASLTYNDKNNSKTELELNGSPTANVTAYSVTYDANGGTKVMDDRHYISGQIAIVKDKPTHKGYTFTGWKLDENTTYRPGDSIVITGNVTLTAQ